MGRAVLVAVSVWLAPALAFAALRAPTGLSATATSGSSIQLAWTDPNNSSNESYVAIERGLDGVTFTQISTVPVGTTSYQNAGLSSWVRYYYRIRAAGNGNTVSPYSTVVNALTPDTIAPSVPAWITAGPASCSQINVSWAASTDGQSGLRGYNVYRGGVFLRQVLAPATSTADTGLAASTTYSYTVTAVDDSGNVSAQSQPVSATTPACPDTTAPSTPTGLTATAASCGQVNLAWYASTDTGGSGLRGYNVYRGGVFVKQVLAPATSTSDTGLTGSTAYSYTVAAIDNAGNLSARSNTAYATTPSCATTTTTTTTTTTSTTTTTLKDTTAPSVPTGLTGSAASCSQINLSWTASSDTGGSGLKGYNIYRGGVYVKQVLAPATTTSDTGLAGGTLYDYNASAVDNAGNVSALSATLSTNTPACADTTPPTTPTGLVAAAASCSQVNLSWNPSTDSGGSGLKGYNVYRNGTFLKQVLAPTTSTSDTGLLASTLYRYTVAAVDNAGNASSVSTASSATTQVCAATLNPTLVGFVPGVGTARDVAIDAVNHIAYVASAEFGLSIVDVSNPMQPRALGAANPPFNGVRVALAGSLATVTGGQYGLHFVDISSRTAPKTVGSLTGTYWAVAMSGQYAYALQIIPGNPARTDLVVVSLSVPSAPLVVGRVTVAGGAGVKVVGSYAYVATGTGLQVVNVSNPVAPAIVGTLTTALSGVLNGETLAIAGNYAYVAENTVLRVVNIATPTNPSLVTTVNTSATQVAIDGSRLYVIGGTAFKILDVSTPSAPVVLGSSDGQGAQGLGASGTLAYLASPNVNVVANTGGLYVWDVSVPSSPHAMSNYSGVFDSWGVAVSGTLGVATGNGDGLKVVDLSVATAPRVVATMNGTMRGVSMAGQYAYVLNVVPGNPAHTDLVVINLGTPSAPVIVGRVTVAGGTGIEVVGSYAYVTTGSALQVVNVSNPAAPAIVATLTTGGTAAQLAVSGGYAYVADGTALRVISVATPTSPRIVASYPTTAATAVAASGTRAYVIDYLSIDTFDVSTPSAPRLLGTGSAYSGQALDAQGNLIFLVSAQTSFVTVVDETVATAPVLVTQVAIPGKSQAVTSTASYVYAGDADGITDVIKLQ